MARTTVILLAAVGVAVGGVVACGSSESGGGGGATGGGGEPAATQGAGPPQARELRMQQDLLDIAHLADVDHRGLYIDMGTPARMKYTTGHWRGGWGSDGAEGDETFTNASEMGRLYFLLREPREVTLRLRMRAVGSRRLQIFVNNRSLPEGVSLAEGDAFRDYDVRVAADLMRAGENYVLLRFGGTTRVGDENVSVQVASVRVIDGAPVADEQYVAPAYDTLAAQVDAGGTERRALTLRSPTSVSYYVEIPRDARLVFGVGTDVAGSQRARVTIQPEGGEAAEIYAAAVGTRWDDQAIDISRFAGQVVRLELSASGEGAGRVAFAVPSIMVTPPAVAERREVRNVVVLLIDTLRASKLRAYDPSSRVRTPVLDRLATEGTVFERAQSQENWTKPSVASVLTGLTPGTHGATTTEAVLPDRAELVSEAFDAAGFATGSFLANGYVSNRFGFDQGWDHYTNMIREERSTEAADVFREAGDFIEQHRSERFFVYIQTIDPHVPYDPPAEFLAMYDDRADYAGQVRPRMTGDLLERAKRTPPGVVFDASDQRRLRGLHDGEISYHDRELGRFLERLGALGVADDTLFLITSDHGEEFNDHGSWGHGHSVYQELLHVPLIVWRPGVVPAQRIAHTVSTLSVSPTVLGAAGVSGLRAAEGRNLMPDILGDVTVGPQVAFSNFLDDRRVIRAGRWKLILRGHNPTFFDLESDPGEQRELDMSRHPIAARYCRVLLGQYLGARDRGHWMDAVQRESAALTAGAAVMDAETCAQLEALGYGNCGGHGGPSMLGATD